MISVTEKGFSLGPKWTIFDVSYPGDDERRNCSIEKVNNKYVLKVSVLTLPEQTSKAFHGSKLSLISNIFTVFLLFLMLQDQ